MALTAEQMVETPTVRMQCMCAHGPHGPALMCTCALLMHKVDALDMSDTMVMDVICASIDWHRVH